MTDNALTVQDADLTNGDLVHIGSMMDQDKIVQLGDNLMGVHPAAKEVGKLGMRTVAQLALMTGANPLPGTNGIHVWVDKKGKLCIQFGMGFWRGKIEEAGGFIWVDRPRPMTDEERAAWGVSDNDTGFICRGTTWDAVRRLRTQEKELGGELSLSEARDLLYKEGTGIVGMDTWGDGNFKEQKQGRAIFWTAAERAERDLCRKLVPIFNPHKWQPSKDPYLIKSSSGPSWGDESGGFTAEEINSQLFPSAEVEDGDYEDIKPEQPESELTEATEAEPAVNREYTEVVMDLASSIQENTHPTFGTVASAAVSSGYYSDNSEALNDLKQAPIVTEHNAKVTAGGKITSGAAVKLFYWLVDRKLDETIEKD